MRKKKDGRKVITIVLHFRSKSLRNQILIFFYQQLHKNETVGKHSFSLFNFSC